MYNNNMRRLLLLVLLLPACFRLSAQNKDLSYFAKVPTRFLKPGLSPMQSLRFNYMGMPGNKWVNHGGELKLDLLRIKLSTRVSAIISGSALVGYKRERHNLYKANGKEAYEQTQYYFAAPSVSAGVSYGFFFPYFLSVRAGVYSPWETARYKAVLPLQYSDQDGVKSRDAKVVVTDEVKGGLQKYATFEIYRPLKSHFKNRRPMGLSLSYTFFPGNKSGEQGAWNFGIYWHKKAK